VTFLKHCYWLVGPDLRINVAANIDNELYSVILMSFTAIFPSIGYGQSMMYTIRP
jgi:hypothetical protein